MQNVDRQEENENKVTEILCKLADGFVGVVWNYFINVSFQKPFMIRRAYQKMSK
jgi:transcription initiation factor TFIID subunit TAF12